MGFCHPPGFSLKSPSTCPYWDVLGEPAVKISILLVLCALGLGTAGAVAANTGPGAGAAPAAASVSPASFLDAPGSFQVAYVEPCPAGCTCTATLADCRGRGGALTARKNLADPVKAPAQSALPAGRSAATIVKKGPAGAAPAAARGPAAATKGAPAP